MVFIGFIGSTLFEESHSMRLSVLSVWFFVFFVVGLPSSVLCEEGPVGPQTVAQVGNIKITNMDVDRRAQKILPMQVSFHGSLSKEKIDEIRQTALDELIVRAYKIQYAIDEEISIDSTSFETAWEKYSSKLRFRDADVMSKFKADFYLDMLAQKAEEVAVEAHVSVSAQEVSDYYQANKNRYMRPKSFTASHILVKVDPSENAEEKEKKRIRVEALLERARSGEDFYNLAYFESDDRSKYVGGSLGTFHAGQTVPEFDAAIQKMKPGEIAGPVRTLYGYHIIKLDASEEERQLQFDEVSEKIRAHFEKEQRDQLYQKWLAQLKEKYPFERVSQ